MGLYPTQFQNYRGCFIKISKISSNIKGEFEDNLTLKSNTILNDSFNIDVEVKNQNSNLEAKFENVSFKSILSKMILNIPKPNNLIFLSRVIHKLLKFIVP